MSGCHVQPEQAFNLIWGYNDRYFEYGYELNPAAADYTVTLTAVPAGEIWILQGVSAHDATTAKRIVIFVSDGTTFMAIVDTTQDIVGRRVLTRGEWVLKEGDKVRIVFVSVTLGDDLYWQVWGYKMVLSQ